MQIPSDYPYAISAAIAVTFHCYRQAWIVSSYRKQIFNKQFMKQHFGQIHQSQIKQQIMQLGYPDTGNGKYSEHLSYKDWYKFNVLQRNHHNYLQNLPIVIAGIMSSGLYKPRLAAMIGALYMLTRICYIQGYTSKHGALNKLRIVGAIGGALCIFANLGIFCYHAFKFFRKN